MGLRVLRGGFQGLELRVFGFRVQGLGLGFGIWDFTVWFYGSERMEGFSRNSGHPFTSLSSGSVRITQDLGFKARICKCGRRGGT